MNFCLIVLLICLINCIQTNARSPITINEILHKHYDKLKPPKIMNGTTFDPVNVTVDLYLLQVRSVDETEMSFTMDIVIKQMWRDERFIFPKTYYDGKVVLDPAWRNEIWTPDVWFKNALAMRMHAWVVPIEYYWLTEEKVIVASGRVTLDLSCEMNMEKFPHDVQVCGVEIMGLMNPSRDLELNWRHRDAVRLSKLMTLPQYDISQGMLNRCDTIVDDDVFSCIRASFDLKRRCGYFFINIYIPTVLIVVMSMLTFWIPPDAVPARITLGVTSLLTIITKQYHSTMPNVSYVVALNVWLSSCIAFVFFSLIEYAIVLTLVKRCNKEMAASHVQKNKVAHETKTDDKQKPSKLAWIPKHLNNTPHLIDDVSRFFFPLAFVTYCIIYYCHYAT